MSYFTVTDWMEMPARKPNIIMDEEPTERTCLLCDKKYMSSSRTTKFCGLKCRRADQKQREKVAKDARRARAAASGK